MKKKTFLILITCCIFTFFGAGVALADSAADANAAAIATGLFNPTGSEANAAANMFNSYYQEASVIPTRTDLLTIPNTLQIPVTPHPVQQVNGRPNGNVQLTKIITAYNNTYTLAQWEAMAGGDYEIKVKAPLAGESLGPDDKIQVVVADVSINYMTGDVIIRNKPEGDAIGNVTIIANDGEALTEEGLAKIASIAGKNGANKVVVMTEGFDRQINTSSNTFGIGLAVGYLGGGNVSGTASIGGSHSWGNVNKEDRPHIFATLIKAN